MEYKIRCAVMNKHGDKVKIVKSEKYNYVYNLNTGHFMRWGTDYTNSPTYAPSPEILDIEVSTICSQGCSWCYKSNTCSGHNMTFDEFKIIFDRLPRTICQIAFGIGDIDANPDLFRMFEYCRENDTVPNVTINGYRMTPEYYDKLAKLCGAVSVSRYEDAEVCYTAVDELKRRGLGQVSIHQILAQETLQDVHNVMHDYLTDSRLTNRLKAIVLLMLKQKGTRNSYNKVEDYKHFKNIITIAKNAEVPIGMDSCSGPSYLRYLSECHDDKYKVANISTVEPCESGLFSMYINVRGVYFPCSFTENEEIGIDVLHSTNLDFLKDVWYNPITIKWRDALIASTKDCKCEMNVYCRKCPVFDVDLCEE